MDFTRRAFLHRAALGSCGLAALPTWTCRLWADVGLQSGSLPRTSPAAAGVDARGVLDFLQAIAATPSELHSFMLLRHGQVLAEGWWAPYAPGLRHTMYSLSKSFTSTGVGLAIAEGRLSVEDKVADFFPEDLPAAPSEELKALRVRHLLTMAVGHEPDSTHAVVSEDNWAKAFLRQPFKHPPGSVFLYNSVATYMCSAIVQKLTGETLIDYLRPRLFDPLEIRGMTWETCPSGINTGGWGLSIQTEGVAKFAQLYLQRGTWKGRQLLPAAWVEEATTFKIQQPPRAKPTRPAAEDDWQQGYCYQFWRCQHHAFRGDGAFGQFAVVLPDQDAVVVMTGESKDLQSELDLVWKHLLPAMKDAPLPPDEEVQARLQQALTTLALPPPAAQKSSTVAAQIAGKRFVLEPNSLNLESAVFAFQDNTCLFTAVASQTSHHVLHGLEAWREGRTRMPGVPPRIIAGQPAEPDFRIAASATWTAPDTLEFFWRYTETPHHDRVTCHFTDNQVTIQFMSSIAELNGRDKEKRPTLQGRTSA